MPVPVIAQVRGNNFAIITPIHLEEINLTFQAYKF